jgi:PAS domain-containing protein
MVTAKPPSLLSFVDAPILVADPDGSAVYANPSFEARFALPQGGAQGLPLATLFESGGREEVLRAFADVCEGGPPSRFRLRIGGVGYVALVSPIVTESARIGAILLLTEEMIGGEKLLAFHRAVQQPVDDLGECLDTLLDQTGGRRSERYRALVEDSLRALERLRKWTDELQNIALGRPSAAAPGARFDVRTLIRRAAAGLEREARGAGCTVEISVPAQLPSVRGDGGRLEAALVHWLRARLARTKAPSLTLAAKLLPRGRSASVLVLVTEGASDRAQGAAAAEPELDLLRDAIASIGGSLRTTQSQAGGRTTAIHFEAGPEQP